MDSEKPRVGFQGRWYYIRANWLSHRLFNSYEEIVDACCDAWNALMALPEVIRSIGNREYAQVKI